MTTGYGFTTPAVDGWVYCPKRERTVSARACRRRCRYYAGRHLYMVPSVSNPDKRHELGDHSERPHAIQHVCNLPIDSDDFRPHYERSMNFKSVQEGRPPLFPDREVPE